jgi:transcriptional regulator with XRE-family HTH domain
MTESDLHKIFSDNVREYRNRCRWSQGELSRRSGLSVNFINNIESEKKWVSPATMLKLANAFRIEVYELYKPPYSLPDNFDGIVRKFTDNIHAAVDGARLAFMREQETPRNR